MIVILTATVFLLQSQIPTVGESIQITRSASTPSSTAPADHFTGSARIDTAFQAKSQGQTSGGARVVFTPGARTAWHTHPLGQLLVVTSGVGRIQLWGSPAQEIRQGDVVWIPAAQKHWHGASPDSAMTHIAIAGQQDGKSVDWMEKVSDEQYGPNPPQPRPSQRAIGDFAPKLADLTDTVLYGDVWERPELSKRDRSLATVAALIALNRPDQLRSHFAIARRNGLSQEELVETITHLAFYTGWPSAVTAIGVAREVFAKQ